ncbi:hypothetical protein KI387_033561, partial [Taxus chinensis]
MAFTSAISRGQLQEVFHYDTVLEAKAIERVIGDSYIHDSHRAIINSELAVVFVSNCLLLHLLKVYVVDVMEFFIYHVYRVSFLEEMDRGRIPDPLLWVEEEDTQ